MKKFKRSLFLFRRDLRLEDNIGLIESLKSSEKVIPSFIFNELQINNNPYKGEFLIQFMLESLADLEKALKAKGSVLRYGFGNYEKEFESLLKNEKIEAVFVNKDYTPFALKRDKALEKICEKKNISFLSFDDALLNPPGKILKDDGNPYTVYTPFYKKSIQLDVLKPKKNSFDNYCKKRIKNNSEKIFKKVFSGSKNELVFPGGREMGRRRVLDLKKLSYYEKNRDFPFENKTSKLSAYHKFGCISVRETYWKAASFFGKDCVFIKELYWRDFFTQIAYFFPHIFKGSFHKKYDQIKWENNKKKFIAWCEGKTGFPIVDAGMRELNATGSMHNRVRMITASFLVKDLHIDWHWGEKYFAKKLIDYDASVNNGNWQWAASTGCDAQPYFRIFNPWLQQKRFDEKCLYIKKWVPELLEIDAKTLHNLFKYFPEELKGRYPLPVVDHKFASTKAKELYKNL